jgi:hypothetical protein
MHYWQDDGLPSAGEVRRRLEAQADRGRDRQSGSGLHAAASGRRNGGIKSGIARAVAQGEAIIRAEAEGRRALARNRSEREAGGQAELNPPRTNHNQRFSSSCSSSSSSVERGYDPSAGAARNVMTSPSRPCSRPGSAPPARSRCTASHARAARSPTSSVASTPWPIISAMRRGDGDLSDGHRGRASPAYKLAVRG